MRSAIYSGLVKHTRLLPKQHDFTYSISMFYLSLKELKQLHEKHWLLSVNKFNILSFKESNYLNISAVQEKIGEAGYHYGSDEVAILTHLSYFGFCYNPVSFYYCYDSSGEKLQFILAEINNTPWDERYVYVLPCQREVTSYQFEFAKKFHISPFMPMNIDYSWQMSQPGQENIIQMQNYSENSLQFQVNMRLKQHPLTRAAIFRYIFQYFLITQRILWRIYFHAFKLWLKKVPFYSHPGNKNA